MKSLYRETIPPVSTMRKRRPARWFHLETVARDAWLVAQQWRAASRHKAVERVDCPHGPANNGDHEGPSTLILDFCKTSHMNEFCGATADQLRTDNCVPKVL